VGEGEMLIEVRVPIRAHAGSAYEKVERRAGDWAIAAVGAVLWLGDDGRIAGAGLGLAALGAPGSTSARAHTALIGHAPAEDLFAHAAGLAAETAQPVSDQRGPAGYKRHLAKELTHRALRRAAERALREEV
jgi:carbon-monoxide dehydrogenase medium subunit